MRLIQESGLLAGFFGKLGSPCGVPDAPSQVNEKLQEGFHKALTEGNMEQVASYAASSKALLLLQLKPSPHRHTAWHLAADQGNVELLGHLNCLFAKAAFPKGRLLAALDSLNKRGQTCLMVACSRGSVPCVQYLLGLGVDATVRDRAGRSALHSAVQAKSLPCVNMLLDWAAKRDEDAEPTPELPAPQDEGGAGPMQAERQPSTLRLPSERLASETNPQPSSPSAWQRWRSFRAGEEDEANTTWLRRLSCATDNHGITPLHVAANKGAPDICRALLTAGASYMAQCSADNFDAGMPANSGWTALHLAALKGYYDIATSILRFHSSLSAQDKLASWRPGEHGRIADPRLLVDRRGTTAYALAVSRSFHDVAEVLDPSRPLPGSERAPVGRDGQELDVPDMYICPITQEIMADPVVSSDGFSYERAAITKWIGSGRGVSPMTNLPMTSRQLFPNNVLRTSIKEWRDANSLPDPRTALQSGDGRLSGGALDSLLA